MCTPVFECVCVHFVRVCVCFTDNCIIGSMLNESRDESNNANGCVTSESMKGAATQWMCVITERTV